MWLMRSQREEDDAGTRRRGDTETRERGEGVKRTLSPCLLVSLSSCLHGFFQESQKTLRPRMASNAGVKVSEASRARARLKAMAGPAQRTLANSANPIIPSPQMTVPALAAQAPPTWPTLRSMACVIGVLSASSSRYRLMRKRQ